MKTPDEEYLFSHMFGIAIKQDLLSCNLHPPTLSTAPGSERVFGTNKSTKSTAEVASSYFAQLKATLNAAPVQQDSPDRKKLQRILTILVQYKANINANNRDGLTALHLAAKTDNSKMIVWLAQQPGIDLDKVSRGEHMTAMMYAAKYGNVKVIAELIKIGDKCVYVSK